MSAQAKSVELRTAFWNYDRTMPLVDGRVPVENARLSISVLRPEETFARAFSGDGFDICEISLSNSITAASRGSLAYVLLPVFLSRAFRHSSIFVRTGSGIRTPRDLRGKIVGLQEYDMTAAVVVRGILRDSYGVEPQEMRWRVGDLERLKPLELPCNANAAPVSIEFMPEGTSLDEGLAAGELDVLIALRPPSALNDGTGRVRRLFPDSGETEKAWYAETGVFPIMHAVGIRRELAESRPELVAAIYEAFCAAKALAVEELAMFQAPKVTLPWPHIALREAMEALGEDFWPYGMAANRHALETQFRWSWQDGLQDKKVGVDDIFLDLA